MTITAKNPPSKSQRGILFRCVAILVMVVISTSSALAQRTAKKEKPEPRVVDLRTKDGMELQAFYFPSSKGKEAIPVLIIHEWKGQASPYINLVKALAAADCAVLVPVYRAHGKSTTYKDRTGKEKKFNLAAMNKVDIKNIMAYDIEEAKRFLKEENNAEKLNLNALAVIGVKEGAVLAANWSSNDWKFPQVGLKKQGQDVKALVFISPEKLLKGVTIDQALMDPHLLRLPLMIVEGNRSGTSDAAKIHKKLAGIKRRMGGGEIKGLEFMEMPEKLNGPMLINQSKKVIPSIVKFITSNVEVTEFENPWINRP